MKTPFTAEQFLDVFRNYNESVFPSQLVFYVVAAFVMYSAVKPDSFSRKLIPGILAFFWIWMGIIYHLVFFTAINNAAYLFGMLFLLEGILIFISGIMQNKLVFRFRRDLYGITGVVFILFALIVYPVIGYFAGHAYPFAPTFGLPCPTVIFTFGVILMSDKKFPVLLLVIPFLWSLLGFTAALNFGIVEDTGLLVAGLLGLSLTLLKNRSASSRDLNKTAPHPKHA